MRRSPPLDSRGDYLLTALAQAQMGEIGEPLVQAVVFAMGLHYRNSAVPGCLAMTAEVR